MKYGFRLPLFILLIPLSMSGCMMMHDHGMMDSSMSGQQQPDVEEIEEGTTTSSENSKDSEQPENDNQSPQPESESQNKGPSTTLYVLGGIGMLFMMGLMML